MALERITFNIAAFNDADAGGDNYFSETIYNVFNTNGTLADIFSDAFGSNAVNQDGIANTSDATGKVLFFIAVGKYYYTVNGIREDFEAGDLDVVALQEKEVIQDGQILALQEGQTGGIIVFQTYAELDAYTPLTPDEEKTSYKVTNDPNSTLNGYYSWISGTAYTKDADLVLNVIDAENSSDAVSGKAVADFLPRNKSYALKRLSAVPVDISLGDSVFYQCNAGINTFNGVTDASGSAIELTLNDSSIIKFTKQARGFTYETFNEYEQGTYKYNSANLETKAVVCKNASFRMTDLTPFQTGSGAISIEVDFTLDHDYGGTANILGYGSNLSPDSVSVGMLNYDRLFIGVGSISDNLFYLYGMEQGKSYHAVYTVDEFFARLYIDGNLIEEKASTPFTLAIHSEFNVGGYYNFTDPDNLFRSPLRMVRYYNKALTQEDVDVLYNKGDTLNHYDDVSNILELNAINCDGTAWVDTSGNENQPYLVIPSTSQALSKVDTLKNESFDAGGIAAQPLSGVNLFSDDNVMLDMIIDSTSGLVAPWVGQESIAGVVKFSVNDVPAWYKIHGIDFNFGGYNVVIAGYNSLDQRLGVLSLSELNNNTFLTFRSNGAVGIVYAMIYRMPSNSGAVPDFGNIYIEQIQSETDYLGTERSNASNNNKISLDATSIYNFNNSNELSTLSGIMKDKKLLVMGDSITANNQWLGAMSKKLGLVKVINSAIGGANIYGSESSDPLVDNNRHLTPQLRFTPFKHDKQIRSYGEFDGVDYVFSPDNVIISMGFNDANNAFPIGDWAAIKLLDWRVMPLDTVQAYLRYNLEKMINDVIDYQIPINSEEIEIKNVAIDCTNSKIIYQIPIHTGGDDALALRLQDVRDAIQEVCIDYSIPIINARDNSGISRFVEVEQGGRYLLDTIHPNAEGYKKLAECNASAFVGLAL